MDFLTGLGIIVNGVTKELTKQEQQQYRTAAVQHKIVNDFSDIFGIGTSQPKQEEVKFVPQVVFTYNVQDLNNMSTDELKEEVYSIYQQHKYEVKDKEKEALAEEARSLYHKYMNSETRYRALLIKFLYEKGNI